MNLSPKDIVLIHRALHLAYEVCASLQDQKDSNGYMDTNSEHEVHMFACGAISLEDLTHKFCDASDNEACKKIAEEIDKKFMKKVKESIPLNKLNPLNPEPPKGSNLN